MNHENICCPRFNPEPWDEKEVVWKNKKFAQDRVVSFMHIPLNFSQVMKRIMKKIEASNVKCEDMIVLTDEDSLWGTNVFVSVSGDVKDAQMTTISGTFLAKVFEGSYKNMGNWIKEMKQYVKSKNKEIKKLYYYYTTCPKCAKEYGKNYTVLLAKIKN
jgi:effector-binding domain-containing protein